MADNLAVTPGSGANLRTDEDTGSSNAHVQYVKLMNGAGNDFTTVDADTGRGALKTLARHDRVRIKATSTTLTTATTPYTVDDCFGDTLTWTSAAATSAKGGIIEGITITDVDKNLAADSVVRLWVFNTAPGGTVSNNSAFAPNDADLYDYLVGFVDFNSFVSDSSMVSTVAHERVQLPYTCAATSLFGVLQLKNLGTGFGYFAANTDVSVAIHVVRD